MKQLFQLSDQQRVDWLRLARTDRIGPVTFQQLIGRYHTASRAIEALPELSRAGGRPPVKIFSQMAAEDELATLASLGAQYVVQGETGYPPYLAHVHAPPPLLCVKGRLELASLDSVAVVGSRNASAMGLKFTRMVAHTLAENGIVVASGLARGIDTAAHEASFDHATAAVIAGGVDHFYPPENAKLQNIIAERGLLITEMPPGTAPKAEHFPRRNRIISGMSRATIVIEAALRSGSLITARFAAEQGRDVFAAPGSPLDPRSEGCNRLIRDGATILTSVDDVLTALHAIPKPQAAALFEPETPHDDPSDEDRKRVLTLLSPTETPLDDIIRESRLPADVIMAIVLELEIAGRVSRSAGGRLALI